MPRVPRSPIGRNVAWNFVGQLWGAGLALVATPVIINALGADGYGVIAMLTVIVNFVWYVDLGLGQASVRYIAEHSAARNWAGVRRVFWTSAGVYVLLASVAAGAMIVLAPFAVREWFEIPTHLTEPAITAFYIAAATFCTGLLNFPAISVIRGLQRFDIATKISVVSTTLQPLITIVLLVAGFPLEAVMIGYLLVSASGLIAHLVVVFRLVPRLSLISWDRETLRTLLRFGTPLSGSTLIVGVLSTFEKFALANSTSMTAVAHYMVASNVASRLNIVPTSISSALYPALSSLGDARERAVELIAKAERSVFIVFLPIFVALQLFSPQLMTLWVGEEFASNTLVVMQILLLASFIQAFSWTPHMLIQAMGRSDLTLKIYLVELAAIVPISIISIGQWGAQGAAIAWLSRAILDTSLVFWYSSRLLQIDPVEHVRESLGPRALLALTGSGLLWLGRDVFGYAASPLEWISVGAGTLLIAIVLQLSRPFNRSEPLDTGDITS